MIDYHIDLILINMVNNIYYSIGKKVKIMRKGLGLTVIELGNKAKLSKESIIKIESGRANPTIKTLYKLSKALKTKPYKLVEGH
jgi:transcriptional regulator with XRE-family HTH domain